MQHDAVLRRPLSAFLPLKSPAASRRFFKLLGQSHVDQGCSIRDTRIYVYAYIRHNSAVYTAVTEGVTDTVWVLKTKLFFFQRHPSEPFFAYIN